MKLSLIFPSLVIFLLLSACNRFTVSPNSPFEMAKSPNLSDWSVVFEQKLKENHWSLGVHYYQFTSDCPDVEFLADLKGTLLHFSVMEEVLQSDLISDKYVDLAFDTVGVNYDGYIVLSDIQPEQKTRFRFGYRKLTLEQAEYAADKCQVAVTVDKVKNISLLPVVQRTEFWHRGYYK